MASDADDVGKRVVAQSGIQVGTVSEVRDGTLHVEVGPDADPDVLDQLGWDGVVNQEVHELEDRYVSTVTDETVRLRV
jgi:hypothetical protein